MNNSTFAIFHEYLRQTDGDKAAAAALTLADTMQNALDAKATEPSSAGLPPPDAMLNLNQAAAKLGYTVGGLRGIIDRSRSRLAGHQVQGPTIKFSQAGKRGRLSFRQEWLDDFIEGNCEGRDVPLLPKPNARKGPGRPAKATPEGDAWDRLTR